MKDSSNDDPAAEMLEFNITLVWLFGVLLSIILLLSVIFCYSGILAVIILQLLIFRLSTISGLIKNEVV